MQTFLQSFEKVKNFKEIFDKGKKFKTFSSQMIIYCEETPTENSKISLGVLALKKIVGKKAVFRNKVKRRYKNGILEKLRTIPIQKGFHLKLIALTNKNTLTSPWSQILSDIEKQLLFINRLLKEKENKIVE